MSHRFDYATYPTVGERWVEYWSYVISDVYLDYALAHETCRPPVLALMRRKAQRKLAMIRERATEVWMDPDTHRLIERIRLLTELADAAIRWGDSPKTPAESGHEFPDETTQALRHAIHAWRTFPSIHPHAALRMLVDDGQLRMLYVCPACQWMLYGTNSGPPDLDASTVTRNWCLQVQEHFAVTHPELPRWEVLRISHED
jgi:hypothetical protein